MSAPTGINNESYSRRIVRTIRIRLAATLAVIVPFGFALKYYSGPLQPLISNSIAGAAYVVFWCLAAAFIWPRRRYILRIVITVLFATSALEVMQLWKPVWLVEIRRTFPGRTLLGTTFTWSDFLFYVLGAVGGWFVLRLLMRCSENARP